MTGAAAVVAASCMGPLRLRSGQAFASLRMTMMN